MRTSRFMAGCDNARPWARSWSAVAVGIVFVVLCLGLYTLWKGGDTARTWSNKLMRIRVLAQSIAIVIIMAVLYFCRSVERLHARPRLICKPPDVAQ